MSALTPGPKNFSILSCLSVHISSVISFLVSNSNTWQPPAMQMNNWNCCIKPGDCLLVHLKFWNLAVISIAHWQKWLSCCYSTGFFLPSLKLRHLTARILLTLHDSNLWMRNKYINWKATLTPLECITGRTLCSAHAHPEKPKCELLDNFDIVVHAEMLSY